METGFLYQSKQNQEQTTPKTKIKLNKNGPKIQTKITPRTSTDTKNKNTLISNNV